MITLSLLKYLENKGFGTIGTDLFWQKIAIGKSGMYIVNLGDSIEKNRRRRQRYELYSVGDDDLESLKKLEAVAQHLRSAYNDINELPAVEGGQEYQFVVVMPPSTISNLGLDNQGRVIYSLNGIINY